MPAAILRDKIPPIIRYEHTPSYDLNQSAFLRVKYGLIDANTRLDWISKLQKNWDSYGAEPPSQKAIEASRQILAELAPQLILPTTIVPSADGGVSTYFIVAQRSAYIETYNDGSQALVLYDRAGHSDVLEIGSELPVSAVGEKILGYLG